MPPPHRKPRKVHNALMDVVLSVHPSIQCLTLSRQRKGIWSWNLAGRKYGRPIPPFRGQKVKFTRSINAVTENQPYLWNGKALKLQTW